jgi:hypothetical protein
MQQKNKIYTTITSVQEIKFEISQNDIFSRQQEIFTTINMESCLEIFGSILSRARIAE